MMGNQLSLKFVEYSIDSFIESYKTAVNLGVRKIRLRPFNEFALKFIEKATNYKNNDIFYVDKHDCLVPLPQNVLLLTDDISIDVTMIFMPEGKSLSDILMEYIDFQNGTIIAPITKYHCQNRPLFLISIPKAGTHLLFKLAKMFGYNQGIVCSGNTIPGCWYCVEYSNSHTSARDFFIDTVRRSAFGNRHHPFPNSPALFIYRNPLDIVVSEANYYHRDGNTIFSGYLNTLNFEERLLRLIDDPWLLGSIRDRVGNFIAWLDFPNVIPVSFEEIIGASGGGNSVVQNRLIWTLQLKLHVPGCPDKFGEKIFDGKSPTFYMGQIGAYRECFSERAIEKFLSLSQDFMEILGYQWDNADTAFVIPKRAEEFRKRPVRYCETNFDHTPIGVEYHFLDHNIVRYKARYFALEREMGAANLESMDETELSKLKSAKDLNAIRRKIILSDS